MVMDKLFGATKRLLPLLSQSFSDEFVEGLKRGEVLVPQRLIEDKVREGFSSDSGVALSSFDMDEEGVSMCVLVQKMGAGVEVLVTLRCEALVLDASSQDTEIVLVHGAPSGQNLLGKIAVFFAGGILASIVKEKITASELVVSHEAGGDDGRVRVRLDLSGIGAVQKLRAPLNPLGASALSLVNVSGVEHREGGLVVKMSLSTGANAVRSAWSAFVAGRAARASDGEG